jgi:hypothetical protein
MRDKVIFRVSCAKVGFWQIDLRLNCALTAGSRDQVVPEARGKQPCSGGRLKCLWQNSADAAATSVDLYMLSFLSVHPAQQIQA